MTWGNGELRNATIYSRGGNPVRVRYHGIGNWYVYVNGRLYETVKKAPGVSTIVISAKRLSTGIDDIDGDTVEESDCEAPVEYFNLQGIRVAHPEAGGLYIRRQGNHVEKVRM